ncbi:hypothetical protein [Desulfurobacterium sp.]|uniref:hypothetical protein n=1 Tax=Desulfurobacterium sp. TaxID=2004706 RepID=UPI002631273F|nr:hypothetical protein [Desulfurobacterium sp.]
MRAEKFFYSLHLITAITIPIFVLVHLLVMHTPFTFVYALYPSCPYAFCLFVTAMVYHGMYGIRGWFVEKMGQIKAADIAFITAGIFLCILLNGSILGYW